MKAIFIHSATMLLAVYQQLYYLCCKDALLKLDYFLWVINIAEDTVIIVSQKSRIIKLYLK
ncbi:hypothetical protein AMR41_22440 [Hapalosiphon sp. MRB220]|nr:hypothetical protein AMR41_22440 [Hapalosiphon sp. MRB220]